MGATRLEAKSRENALVADERPFADGVHRREVWPPTALALGGLISCERALNPEQGLRWRWPSTGLGAALRLAGRDTRGCPAVRGGGSSFGAARAPQEGGICAERGVLAQNGEADSPRLLG